MTREEIETCWKTHAIGSGASIIARQIRERSYKASQVDGWTVNFARPSAIPVVLLSVAIVVVPLHIVTANGAGSGIELTTGAASITALCLVCAYLSSRTE